MEVTDIAIADQKRINPGHRKAVPVQRFERKFTVQPRNTGFAYSMLRQVCRPDRDYPRGRINSLYFDNIDLEQYQRSEAGEFRKDKVRIRWYGDISEEHGEIPVYIELKSRQGFASSKKRHRLLVSAEKLRSHNLSNGIVSRSLLNETLAGFGYFPDKPLIPVIYISYQRYRFNEIQTGIRVSFDYEIHARVVAPELSRRDRSIRLSWGVIEVKGPTLELPGTLRRMKLLDTDWSRFSKYGCCLDTHFARPGSVSRSWPVGRMIET
jgi:hypothetical protein